MSHNGSSRKFRAIDFDRIYQKPSVVRVYRPLDLGDRPVILDIRDAIIDALPPGTDYWMRAQNRYGVTILSNRLVGAQPGAHNIMHRSLANEIKDRISGPLGAKIMDVITTQEPVWYGNGAVRTLAISLSSEELQYEGEVAREVLRRHLGAESLIGVGSEFEPHLTIGQFACKSIPNLKEIFKKVPKTVNLDKGKTTPRNK